MGHIRQRVLEREGSWPDNASHIPFEKLETMCFFTKLYCPLSTIEVRLMFTSQWEHDGGV